MKNGRGRGRGRVNAYAHVIGCSRSSPELDKVFGGHHSPAYNRGLV